MHVQRQARAAGVSFDALLDVLDMVGCEVETQGRFVVCAQDEAHMVDISAAFDRRRGPRPLGHRGID